MRPVGAYCLLSVAMLWSGAIGAGLHQRYRGSAEVYTNMDDATPLNHGQKSFTVELPAGYRFRSWGGCSPQWQSPDPDHVAPTYHAFECQVEKYDPKFGGFREAREPNGWVEVTR